ncbi:MAG: glycosyltransferase family 4 protein, partial [Cyclobacteriaceae bacterium]
MAFEIRDLWPLTPILLGHISKWNPMIILMKIIEKKAYRSSDLIISLLPKANSYVNTISRNAGKFFYLPNGFSDHVNEDGIIPDELTNKIPTEKFIVGYAGSLGIANAMSVVIEAAKILRDLDDIHFLIIGDGYLKDALIEQAGKINNITFLPKIKKGLVHKVVAKFNVGIISWNDSPLYDYGVSANKLFDYMNAEIPIISAG